MPQRPRAGSHASESPSQVSRQSTRSIPLHGNSSIRLAVEPSREEELDHEIEELYKLLKQRTLSDQDRRDIKKGIRDKKKDLSQIDAEIGTLEGKIERRRQYARAAERKIADMDIPPKLLELWHEARILERQTIFPQSPTDSFFYPARADKSVDLKTLHPDAKHFASQADLLISSSHGLKAIREHQEAIAKELGWSMRKLEATWDQWSEYQNALEEYDGDADVLAYELSQLTAGPPAVTRSSYLRPGEETEGDVQARRAEALASQGLDPSPPLPEPPSRRKEMIQSVKRRLSRGGGGADNGEGSSKGTLRSLAKGEREGTYRMWRRYWGEGY
ncbi:hypothetical protein JCM10450v2_007599 [Rhodotorula kratochvilovae]